jgi:salicylate hydroxylase
MESSPPPIQITIIGAGIGGLGLAIGLLTHAPHIAFTIYEAAADFSVVGAGIAFAPNALLAMSLLSPAFRASYEAIATGNQDLAKQHVFFDMVLAEEGFGASRGCGPQSIAYDYFRKSSAHRWDLLQVMKALVPADRVRFGKRAVRIWQVDRGVRVLFADGQEIDADAVVGCDGGKGVSRQAVLGDRYPDNVAATYSGRYVYRAVVPMDRAREILGDYAGDGKMFMGPGTYFATYQMSNGTQLNMLAARQKEEPWTHDKWTQETTKEEMIKDFEGQVDSRLVKLLEVRTPFAHFIYCTSAVRSGHNLATIHLRVLPKTLFEPSILQTCSLQQRFLISPCPPEFHTALTPPSYSPPRP